MNRCIALMSVRRRIITRSCLVTPPGDEAAKARSLAAFDEIMQASIDLGGTVTGEHGVGLLKLPGAREELGERVIGLHAAIKRAHDPLGTLNPGKAYTA